MQTSLVWSEESPGLFARQEDPEIKMMKSNLKSIFLPLWKAKKGLTFTEKDLHEDPAIFYLISKFFWQTVAGY